MDKSKKLAYQIFAMARDDRISFADMMKTVFDFLDVVAKDFMHKNMTDIRQMDFERNYGTMLDYAEDPSKKHKKEIQPYPYSYHSSNGKTFSFSLDNIKIIKKLGLHFGKKQKGEYNITLGEIKEIEYQGDPHLIEKYFLYPMKPKK